MSERITETLDYTDWAEELKRNEVNLSNVEVAISDQMDNGYSPQQIGRWAVAGRAMGVAHNELVPPTKALVQTGAAREWAARLQKQKETVEKEDGRRITVRRFIAPVGDEEGREWQQYNDPQAVARAENYLLNRVPGHVKTRLQIIAANDGDVQGAADKLKQEIDRIAEELA